MQKSTFDKKVLLYSGGMDSWLIRKIWKPDICLYVDMNTQYSKEEIKRLPPDVVIEHLDLSRWEREDKIIPLRNLYLIGLATNYGNEICIGATAGDRVLDKSLQFRDMYQEILCYLYQKQHWTEERKIRLNFDFKEYTKTQLIRRYLEEGGDINEAFNASFSCYQPENGKECWHCKPCFRKFIAFALNGMEFPKEISTHCLNYIMTEIWPSIKAGTYGRAQEEEEIKAVLRKYNRIV